MAFTEYTPAQIEQFYQIVCGSAGLHQVKGNEWRCCCTNFDHNGDNDTTFWINMESGAFCCFSCGVKGRGIYSFAQEVLRRKSASGQAPEHGAILQWIAEILGTPFFERVYPENLRHAKSSDKDWDWDRDKAQDYYIYTDEVWQELYRVYKFVDGEGNKITPPDHPCPCARDPKAKCEPKCRKGRVWGAKGIRRVLYGPTDVLLNILIFIVEGEANAKALRTALAAYITKHGGFKFGNKTFPGAGVTTNMGGAQGWKPEYGYGKYFTGRIVIKLGDRNLAGERHDEAVCKDVCNFAKYLCTLPLPVGEGEDIGDFIKQRGEQAIPDLVKLLETDRIPYAVATQKSATVGDSIPEPRVILVHPIELGSASDMQGDCLVDGLIERGQRGLVVAPPKVGKSLLFLDLAVSLASMTRFLSSKPYCRPVRSAIISREDGPQLVRRRLSQLAAGRGLTLETINPYILVNTVQQSKSFHIDVQKDLVEMAEWLKAGKVEFCILDVLNKLHLQKENSSDDMTKVMLKFDELAELSGAQVCVIHHLARAGNVKGSTSIEAWADYICRLEADSSNEALKTITMRTKATGLIEPRTVRYWQSEDKSQSRILLVTKIEKANSHNPQSSAQARSARVM